MKSDYEYFVSECKTWIKRLGLDNWEVTFSHEKLRDNHAADCNVDLSSHMATIRFNNNFKERPTKKEIKRFAKHEVIHILLGRLSRLGESRYITENELYSAEEELIIKLEKLL